MISKHWMKRMNGERAGTAFRLALAMRGLVVICLLFFLGAATLVAQEGESEESTNDAVSAEVLARLTEMIQSAESARLEDAFAQDSTNHIPEADAAARGENRVEKFGRPDGSGKIGSSNGSQAPSRSPSDERRSRNRRPSRSRSGGSSSSGAANETAAAAGERVSPPAAGNARGPAGLDYSAFKVIADRNIFDPNRTPRSRTVTVRQPSKQVDSLTLVGTMSYENGTFAFFDGSSSEYKKALKLTDAIAGYRLTNIAPDSVKLAVGTNELELRVGMQLRREEKGPWVLASRSGSYAEVAFSPSTNAAASTASSGTNAVPSAEESEIIKRLMQRRAQE